MSLPKRAYTVTGMTCEHCRTAVMREVIQVRGVTGVDVDLGSEQLTVAGESFEDAAIKAAVDEAGYALKP